MNLCKKSILNKTLSNATSQQNFQNLTIYTTDEMNNSKNISVTTSHDARSHFLDKRIVHRYLRSRSSFYSMAQMQINYDKKELLPEPLFKTLEVICLAYMSSDDTRNEQIVAMKDDIIDAAKTHNFCREVKYTPKQVGPHPCNREGEGLSDLRAQSRVMVMQAGGLSKATLRPNSISMQENPFSKHIEDFTLKLCAKSSRYARFEKNMILAGTLGAGHAMHGLAQVLDEVPCDLPKISMNGRMSKMLCYQDRNLKSACEDGVMFDELDYRIEIVFPAIPVIVSAALNTVSQGAQGENWHSMLLKITNHVKAAWPSPDMLEIKKLVMKSQPPRPQDVPDMADFVRKWGGLPTGNFITELSELCNIYVDPSRIVSGSLFAAFFSLPVKASEMHGEFVNAMVFAHARADTHVHDGICRLYQKPDILSLVKPDKMKNVEMANGMIIRFRSALASTAITPDERLRFLADFKVAVVEAVMQRKGSKEKRNLATIAADFAGELASIHGGTAPSNIVPAAAEADEGVGNASGEFVTYMHGEAEGMGKIQMAAQGFHVGDVVKHRKSSSWSLYKIKDISESMVDLNPIRLMGLYA